MGRMQRAKGARGELEACKAWEACTGFPAVRTAPLQAAGGTAAAPDIKVHPVGLSVEVKRYRSIALHSWVRKAEQGHGKHTRTVLLSREDGGDWIMSHHLSDVPIVARLLAYNDPTGVLEQRSLAALYKRLRIS